MSDRKLRKALAGALLATALLANPATATDDCAPMSTHFAFCAGESPWAEARWVQFGDGAALELDGLWLEFTEHWPMREDDDPLETALDLLLHEIMDAEAEALSALPEILIRDRFETADLQLVRVVQKVDMDEDENVLFATMIAQGASGRIVLMMNHDGAQSLAELDRATRDVADLIRPVGEG